MRRQCARASCSAIATATFTFDAEVKTVWLDAPSEGAARAGELCERHVRALTPPQGWELDDRRAPVRPAQQAVTENSSARANVPDNVSDLRRVLDARTPLLARAFRAAGTV
ncbi:MAG TPA: DUF3499 family protein [Acidimicrobiia bacterium]|nr:DUF3499 family protein [Acidimicrobiia bacterium]